MINFIILVILTSSLLLLIHKKNPLKTSTLAIVMALGIFTQGVLPHLDPGFQKICGFLTVFILSIWLTFLIDSIHSIRRGQFLYSHFKDPINRFGIGTWVAGTSICGLLINHFYPTLVVLSQILFFINLCLWIFFISSSFRTLIFEKKQLFKNANGSLLLTTVSTQSIAIFLNSVWQIHIWQLNFLLISLGLCLYLFCIGYIIKRYLNKEFIKNLAAQWQTTNCIVHGAVSITVLACETSHTVSPEIITILWFLAALLFIFIEGIELIRAYKRVRAYGLRKALFIYNLSHWSRLFTFGMFYTMTSLFKPTLSLYVSVRTVILNCGIWIIIMLILLEVLLLATDSLKNFNQLNRLKEENIRG